MSLKVFDKKRTSAIGLWWHPENARFTSQAFNLSSLKQFKGTVRLIVQKNRFFNGGENGRPNYTAVIVDSDSTAGIELQVEDDNSPAALLERLREVMIEGQLNADVMMLPSESQARAKELHDKAVSLVEELTGEKWEFSFLTF